MSELSKTWKMSLRKNLVCGVCRSILSIRDICVQETKPRAFGNRAIFINDPAARFNNKALKQVRCAFASQLLLPNKHQEKSLCLRGHIYVCCKWTIFFQRKNCLQNTSANGFEAKDGNCFAPKSNNNVDENKEDAIWKLDLIESAVWI